MKIHSWCVIIVCGIAVAGCNKNAHLAKSIQEELAHKTGAVVFVDIHTGEKIHSNRALANERMAPCSTFKIWNTLIGIDSGIINSSDELFYVWDGMRRPFPDWNRDMTLKDAFRVSCVPAYQALAVRIGPERMRTWIASIDYGDRDIQSGIDDFWLPRKGKKSILISSEEQAILIEKLVTGKLPFSDKAMRILQEVMMVRQTPRGTLYGKTGSGTDFNGKSHSSIGWYVGYIVAEKGKYSFACLVKGERVSGKNAKEIIENILAKNKLL